MASCVPEMYARQAAGAVVSPSVNSAEVSTFPATNRSRVAPSSIPNVIGALATMLLSMNSAVCPWAQIVSAPLTSICVR